MAMGIPAGGYVEFELIRTLTLVTVVNTPSIGNYPMHLAGRENERWMHLPPNTQEPIANYLLKREPDRCCQCLEDVFSCVACFGRNGSRTESHVHTYLCVSMYGHCVHCACPGKKTFRRLCVPRLFPNTRDDSSCLCAVLTGGWIWIQSPTTVKVSCN